MTPPHVPYYAPWIAAVAYTAAPAYFDYRYRAVPEYFWYIGGKVGAFLALLAALSYMPFSLLPLMYGVSLVVPAAVAASAAVGAMGLGDLWAALAISLTLPAPLPGSLPLPPSLIVFLYASLGEVATRAALAAKYCGRRSLRCLNGVELPCGRLINMRWWFPAASDITSDEPSEAVVRACQGSWESKVKARPGLPFVTFVLIALPLAYLTEYLLRVP